jgi:hypothetical protein
MDEHAVEPHIGAKRRGSTQDRAIAELAKRQHGVVSRVQLMDVGVGRRAIGNRLERGRLHAVHRGVYAVGHPLLTAQGRWMAAVLAVGPGAALSHRSAAALWGLRVSAGPAEVTVVGQRRSRERLRLHQANLAADEVTVVSAIPVTTVPRTLLDLAAVLQPSRVERAVHEAEVRRLADPLSLDQLVARYPGRRGIAVIKAVLAEGRLGLAVTRSEFEARFLEFVDRSELPRPEVNVGIGAGGRRLEADCVWRTQRLVVELDGHAAHGTRRSFERDRARDRSLQTEGWRVLRITWRQLHRDPNSLAADLRTLLNSAPAGG